MLWVTGIVIHMKTVCISSTGPYDFDLSTRIRRSFTPDQSRYSSNLRCAVRIKDKLTVLQFQQIQRNPSILEIRAIPPNRASVIKHIGRWITFADLNLLPFYKLISSHPVLGPIGQKLHGLKPMRPVSLFEMLVIAITEQQISLVAAYRIRTRLIERFGEPVDGLWVFPNPIRLSKSSVADLMKCGLSQRKAAYVKGLAHNVAHRLLDLDQLETMSDEGVRSILLQQKGLGPWSVDYFLVRGLNRMDIVPANDLGIRDVVGRYLGSGKRLSPQGTMRKLSPFRPYRGLAAFYLLAHERFSGDLAG
jgi:DNA-3-methyladenine glycosylase II